MSDTKKEVKTKPAESEPKGPPKSVVREYFESLVVTLIMAIFGMTFILQAVTVPTGSMQNTILIGDYLLVNKFIFAPSGNPLPLLPQRKIRRGDIIVFKYPGFPNNTKKVMDEGGIPYQVNFVKRVVGLPGETVEVRNSQVFINGKLLPEHRVIGESESPSAALTVKEFEPRQPNEFYDVYYNEAAIQQEDDGGRGYDFASAGEPYKIPEDSYFVMGDSRNQSLDSRYWGVVKRDLIIGQAMFVYWSCDRSASQDGLAGCLTHPRLDRIGKMVK